MFCKQNRSIYSAPKKKMVLQCSREIMFLQKFKKIKGRRRLLSRPLFLQAFRLCFTPKTKPTPLALLGNLLGFFDCIQSGPSGPQARRSPGCSCRKPESDDGAWTATDGVGFLQNLYEGMKKITNFLSLMCG